LAKDWLDILREGINVTGPADNRLQARNDLAWAISVGGIGVVLFAALLAFTWQFAATLFLIFSGILLGVALNAMSNLLGRVVRLPHALRLTVVCLVVAGMLSGIVFLDDRPADDGVEQHAQVATRQRQRFSGTERHRHQLLRLRHPVAAVG
jgi:predicted PurR-regulated permease PerM